MNDWPFDELEPHAYGVILADPAWRWIARSKKGEAKGASRHYRTMSRAALYALPVWKLAAPNCALCLWTTQSMLPMQLDLLKHWGFTYRTYGVWGKRSSSWTPGKENPRWAFGQGYWERSCAEVYLWGGIGAPSIKSKSERNFIEAAVREHSRKPEDIYAKIERMFPLARKLDLFSRKTRPGWDNWGDERDKFDEEEQK